MNPTLLIVLLVLFKTQFFRATSTSTRRVEIVDFVELRRFCLSNFVDFVCRTSSILFVELRRFFFVELPILEEVFFFVEVPEFTES